MEWAKTTDLADLNFMVPEDPTVQTLLQNFMNGSKVDLDECPFDKAVLSQRGKSLAYGLKDLEIMEKFCTPTSYPLKATSSSSQIPKQIVVPELAKKLVEVEYMMRGQDMPSRAEVQLYSKFKEEHPEAPDRQFKNYLSEVELV